MGKVHQVKKSVLPLWAGPKFFDIVNNQYRLYFQQPLTIHNVIYIYDLVKLNCAGSLVAIVKMFFDNLIHHRTRRIDHYDWVVAFVRQRFQHCLDHIN